MRGKAKRSQCRKTTYGNYTNGTDWTNWNSNQTQIWSFDSLVMNCPSVPHLFPSSGILGKSVPPNFCHFAAESAWAAQQTCANSLQEMNHQSIYSPILKAPKFTFSKKYNWDISSRMRALAAFFAQLRVPMRRGWRVLVQGTFYWRYFRTALG